MTYLEAKKIVDKMIIHCLDTELALENNNDEAIKEFLQRAEKEPTDDNIKMVKAAMKDEFEKIEEDGREFLCVKWKEYETIHDKDGNLFAVADIELGE